MYSEECSTVNEYSCQDVQECETEYETVCDSQDTGGYEASSKFYWGKYYLVRPLIRYVL